MQDVAISNEVRVIFSSDYHGFWPFLVWVFDFMVNSGLGRFEFGLFWYIFLFGLVLPPLL